MSLLKRAEFNENLEKRQSSIVYMFSEGIKKGYVFNIKSLNRILNTFFMTFPCLEKTVGKK